MPESILTTTKAALGLEADYTVYDPELVMHINSVLGTLNQLGLGPDEGFAITDDSQSWDDFLGNDPRYNPARSLTYLRVKMLFDPPTVGYLITAYEKMIDEQVWRINVAREELVHPLPAEPPEEDLEDTIILDGDPS